MFIFGKVIKLTGGDREQVKLRACTNLKILGLSREQGELLKI
jgi:hypothetical protein